LRDTQGSRVRTLLTEATIRGSIDNMIKGKTEEGKKKSVATFLELTEAGKIVGGKKRVETGEGGPL